MNKNLLTFIGVAVVGYFGYKWYKKRQRIKQKSEENAKESNEPIKESNEPIKVEVKTTSGAINSDVKTEEITLPTEEKSTPIGKMNYKKMYGGEIKRQREYMKMQNLQGGYSKGGKRLKKPPRPKFEMGGEGQVFGRIRGQEPTPTT